MAAPLPDAAAAADPRIIGHYHTILVALCLPIYDDLLKIIAAYSAGILPKWKKFGVSCACHNSSNDDTNGEHFLIAHQGDPVCSTHLRTSILHPETASHFTIAMTFSFKTPNDATKGADEKIPIGIPGDVYLLGVRHRNPQKAQQLRGFVHRRHIKVWTFYLFHNHTTSLHFQLSYNGYKANAALSSIYSESGISGKDCWWSQREEEHCPPYDARIEIRFRCDRPHYFQAHINPPFGACYEKE